MYHESAPSEINEKAVNGCIYVKTPYIRGFILFVRMLWTTPHAGAVLADENRLRAPSHMSHNSLLCHTVLRLLYPKPNFGLISLQTPPLPPNRSGQPNKNCFFIAQQRCSAGTKNGFAACRCCAGMQQRQLCFGRWTMRVLFAR